jgi:hypothetical protein
MEEFINVDEPPIDIVQEVVEQYEILQEVPTEVFIEINENNEIIKIFSTDFEQPKQTSIKIDEGFGDRYRHAQSQYFEKPLVNEVGAYNYKYINKKVEEYNN